MGGKRQGKRSFGAIRRLPSGRYQASYVGPDGARYQAGTTFATSTDADVWLATIRADIVRDVWRAPRASNDTVAAYVRRWIEQHRGLKATTRNLYLNTWLSSIDGSAIGSLPRHSTHTRQGSDLEQRTASREVCRSAATARGS